MDQMEFYHRYPMRGPVALDLHFSASQRNPPSIHRAVKHTLDLLGPALPGNQRPRRRSVLYRDDRQIKLLYADMDQYRTWEGDSVAPAGHIFLAARRASDALTELCLAARLHSHRQDDDEEDEESPFWSPDIPEEPEPGWPLDPDPAPTALEQYLADSVRFFHVTSVQEAILAQTDATMTWALGCYLDNSESGDRPAELASILEKSQAATRELLLSNPFTLPLPSLPRAAGQSAYFIQMIRASLEEFRARLPLFQTLLVPITLTFLVVPPEQGKDLDNIGLTVLPIAHEVLRPHISPHLLHPAHGDEERTSRHARLTQLRSVNARSVRGYQVIELPRFPQDPPEGTLRLALGLHSHESWWERASTYLNTATDRADQEH
jgi:hypothetical protein